MNSIAETGNIIARFVERGVESEEFQLDAETRCDV